MKVSRNKVVLELTPAEAEVLTGALLWVDGSEVLDDIYHQLVANGIPGRGRLKPVKKWGIGDPAAKYTNKVHKGKRA